MNWAVIIPLIVGVFGAIGAYFAAIRKLSGKISTSTAEDLWAESRQMRKDLNTRIEQLSATVISMQDRIDKLLDQNAKLVAEVGELKQSIIELKEALVAARGGNP